MCVRKQTPGFIEIFHSVVLTKLFNQKDYVLPQGKTTQKDYVLPQGKKYTIKYCYNYKTLEN